MDIIFAVIFGGVGGAIISTILQKRSEKESRIFNAKLAAYAEFTKHLQNFYGKKLKSAIHSPDLDSISSECLLVGAPEINSKIKAFNIMLVELMDKRKSKAQQGIVIENIVELRDQIESLMREDLGFIKKSSRC